MPTEFAQILINSSGAVVTSAMFLWFLLKIFSLFSKVASDQAEKLMEVSQKLAELTTVIGKQNEVTEEQNKVIIEQKDIIQKMYEEFLKKYKKARG